MVTNRQRRVKVALKPLEHFLDQIRKELKLKNAEVSVALVSDAEMARLNETYRGKKGPTDVLSFPPAKPRSPAGRWSLIADRFLGHIAIAPETAARYAKKNGRTLRIELPVLMLHGVLHLLGYDHETDRGQMNRIEQRLRRRLGLA